MPKVSILTACFDSEKFKILKGKPKIYVVGDYLDRCMFYFHPVVKRIKNIEDLIIQLQIESMHDQK